MATLARCMATLWGVQGGRYCNGGRSSSNRIVPKRSCRPLLVAHSFETVVRAHGANLDAASREGTGAADGSSQRFLVRFHRPSTNAESVCLW